MRGVLLLAALAGLAGCAALSRIFVPQAAACPEVTRAEAWVNRMPGPQPPDQALLVSLRLETSDLWMLRAMPQAEASEVLELELLPGGTGYPGMAGFRSTKAALPARIEITCSGKEHHTITEILTVR